MKQNLYDSFAERWLQGGTVFFYSDPHFGDSELNPNRKNYPGDEEQVKLINSKIGKKDTIIFLGDIGDMSYIQKIRGRKILIMGNHDAGASNYTRKVVNLGSYDKYVEKYGKPTDKCFYRCSDGNLYYDNHYFDEVYEGILVISDKILLSHEPVNCPHLMFNIHGHVHSMPGNRQNFINSLNVCAENIDYTPVSLTSIVKSGLLSNVPNIHRITIDNATKRKNSKKIVC